MEYVYCNLEYPDDHPGPHDPACLWSPENWNDVDRWPNHIVSWNAPLCEFCWEHRNNNRVPVRVMFAKPEVCSDCGDATRSGIYFRNSPDNQNYKHWEEA